MASLQSAAPGVTPSPAAHKGYDPEITDIADYVLNKNIDSELAVSSVPCPSSYFKKKKKALNLKELYIRRTGYKDRTKVEI